MLTPILLNRSCGPFPLCGFRRPGTMQVPRGRAGLQARVKRALNQYGLQPLWSRPRLPTTRSLP